MEDPGSFPYVFPNFLIDCEISGALPFQLLPPIFENRAPPGLLWVRGCYPLVHLSGVGQHVSTFCNFLRLAFSRPSSPPCRLVFILLFDAFCWFVKLCNSRMRVKLVSVSVVSAEFRDLPPPWYTPNHHLECLQESSLRRVSKRTGFVFFRSFQQ